MFSFTLCSLVSIFVYWIEDIWIGSFLGSSLEKDTNPFHVLIMCQTLFLPRSGWKQFMACRWCAKYRWKALDEGYNFVLNLTSIRGLHQKLWASKVVKVPILRILKLPTWEFQEKITFGCRPRGQTQNYTTRGKVVVSPKPKSWWVLWIRVCPWLIHAPKVFQLRTNQHVVWFVKVCVNNWLACHLS
jgi:hypothetical protein